MRPTFAIIAFTVLSGTGYGLWFVLGLVFAIDAPSCVGRDAPACAFPAFAAYGLVLGFVLVSAGLLSSLGHLGQPQRAWRALSQWRTSWLSREGVASLLAYVPATLLIAAWLATSFGAADVSSLVPAGAWRAIGVALAVLSPLTVYCTAQIYASLKPIRAWHHRSVVLIYLVLAAFGGALCFWAVSTLPHAGTPEFARALPFVLGAVAVLAALGAVLKWRYWHDIDRLPPIGAGEATGLGALGTTRSFEQPHTEENYLTREMGFVLARKHAAKLRVITLIAAFALPGTFALVALALPATQPFAAWIALVAGVDGLLVERWLFFAQARHAVMGYYAR